MRTLGCKHSRQSWRVVIALCLSVCCFGIGAQPVGEKLFLEHCSACHQPDASGTVGLAPTLKGEHWAALGSHALYLPTVLLKGLSGRIDVAGQVFVGNMPSFAAVLDDAQILALTQHVRNLQTGATTPLALTTADVAGLRQAPGSPTQSRQLRQSLLQGQR